MRLALLALLFLPTLVIADVIGNASVRIERGGESVALSCLSKDAVVKFGLWGDDVVDLRAEATEFGADLLLIPRSIGVAAILIQESTGVVSFMLVYVVEDTTDLGDVGVLPVLDPARLDSDPRP